MAKKTNNMEGFEKESNYKIFHRINVYENFVYT